MKKIVSAALSVIISAVMLIVPASAASKLAAPSGLKAAAKSTTSISLSWKAVKNASKYTVYYSTSKKGDYEKYGATSKTSAIVKKLKAGTHYYFRVYASGKVDGKTVTSAYSAADTFTKKEAFTNTAASLKITRNPGTVSNNDYATLEAVGKPNTEYTLTVYYSTTASKAKGTGKAKSDANGKVSWTWKVGAKTAPGEHKIVITGNGEKIETNFKTVK